MKFLKSEVEETQVIYRGACDVGFQPGAGNLSPILLQMCTCDLRLLLFPIKKKIDGYFYLEIY